MDRRHPFQVDVVALSPQAVAVPLLQGVVGRAVQRGLVRLRVWQLREFSRDPHRKVDDVPFGGGPGMVLMPEPLVLAAEHALGAQAAALGCGAGVAQGAGSRVRVVALAASGYPFTQELARELACLEGLVVLCGRYEGMDARVAAVLDALEVGVGEFVMSTGELAACCLVDAVVRLLPGAVGEPASVVEESFGPPGSLTHGLLEYPQYTRPRVFRGLAVPDVLVGGDHHAVARWRREQAWRLTRQRRPHLAARRQQAAEPGGGCLPPPTGP
ncbi:MAG TPA: tRNA (guanosine(37)-N1)-methyltransferase TrmD [Limnochordales bacterium]